MTVVHSYTSLLDVRHTHSLEGIGSQSTKAAFTQSLKALFSERAAGDDRKQKPTRALRERVDLQIYRTRSLRCCQLVCPC